MQSTNVYDLHTHRILLSLLHWYSRGRQHTISYVYSPHTKFYLFPVQQISNCHKQRVM
jgi:hypothetical protein